MADASGLAPIFVGWNVWNVWQKNDLDFEVMMAGLDAERRLRIWVENTADNAAGAKLSDPLNPSLKHLNGDEVEVLPAPPDGLELAAMRETVPGPTLLLDGPATLKTVRFWNWGKSSNLAWPHDSNYLLEGVYTPSMTNPVTSAPAPTNVTETTEDGAKQAAAALGDGLKVAAVVAGAVLAVVLLSKFSKRG